jgi:hypothetical protein
MCSALAPRSTSVAAGVEIQVSQEMLDNAQIIVYASSSALRNLFNRIFCNFNRKERELQQLAIIKEVSKDAFQVEDLSNQISKEQEELALLDSYREDDELSILNEYHRHSEQKQNVAKLEILRSISWQSSMILCASNTTLNGFPPGVVGVISSYLFKQGE